MTEENQALIEAHGVSPRSTLEQRVAIGKAMLIVLGAGGSLSPREMECFLSVAAAYGAAPEAIDEWKSFDYAHARLSDHFQGDARLARHLMYDAIRILRASGEGARPRAAKAGRLLGVPPGLVSSLEGIIEVEERLRQTRAALEVSLKGRTNGVPAAGAAGLKAIAEKEASLRTMRISMMDEGKGLPPSPPTGPAEAQPRR